MDADEGRQRQPRGRHTPARRWSPSLRALVLDLRDPRERLAAGIVVVGLVLGATIGLVGLLGRSGNHVAAMPPAPPSPTSSVALSPARSAPSPPTKQSAAPRPPRCSTPALSTGGAAPVQICIPVLGVDASMMQLGLNQDRTVQVPPLSRVGDAGWYKYSAEPGDVGPTVILGQVDSARYGKGVFYRLGMLHVGDQVVVSRADGMIATFRVEKVAEMSTNRFPTDAVYGATSRPVIRLVTCGGRFNSATGSYEDSIIAYGTLLSLRHR